LHDYGSLREHYIINGCVVVYQLKFK